MLWSIPTVLLVSLLYLTILVIPASCSPWQNMTIQSLFTDLRFKAKKYKSNRPTRTQQVMNPSMIRNSIPIGMIPDWRGVSHAPTTMKDLNDAVGYKAMTYGYYAQVYPDKNFTGSQLLAVFEDVKQSGAIFEPAIMPIQGWGGLRKDDNWQAINIANVCKKFTDAGIQVRLRFGHEVNYYAKVGRYGSGANEYKEAFAQVSLALRSIAPSVKMWYSPMRKSLDAYKLYMPELQYIDLIGIDMYPQSKEDATSKSLILAMKQLHDIYTSDGRIKFAIGETGIKYSTKLQDKVDWLKAMTDPEIKKALPNLVSVTWFNVVAEKDFRIIYLDRSNTNVNSGLQNLLRN